MQYISVLLLFTTLLAQSHSPAISVDEFKNSKASLVNLPSPAFQALAKSQSFEADEEDEQYEDEEYEDDQDGLDGEYEKGELEYEDGDEAFEEDEQAYDLSVKAEHEAEYEPVSEEDFETETEDSDESFEGEDESFDNEAEAGDNESFEDSTESFDGEADQESYEVEAADSGYDEESENYGYDDDLDDQLELRNEQEDKLSKKERVVKSVKSALKSTKAGKAAIKQKNGRKISTATTASAGGTKVSYLASIGQMNSAFGIAAASILILTGLFTLLFNVRVLKPILFIFGFYIFAVLGFGVFYAVKSTAQTWVIGLSVTVSGLIGGGLFLLAFGIAAYIFGAALGLTLGVLILSLPFALSNVIKIVIVSVTLIGGIVTGHFVKKPLMIVSASIIGAFAFFSGLDYFLKTGFGSVLNAVRDKALVLGVGGWAMLGSCVFAAIAASIVHLSIDRKERRAQYVPLKI